jgi:hypothetical protein
MNKLIFAKILYYSASLRLIPFIQNLSDNAQKSKNVIRLAHIYFPKCFWQVPPVSKVVERERIWKAGCFTQCQKLLLAPEYAGML